MIEDGIVLLVQADPAVLALCTYGGYWQTLPKGVPLPSWSYTVISEVPEYTLAGRANLTVRRLQINTHASDGAQCLKLARAIDNVLSGYYGTLPDPQATVVQGCFRDNEIDDFMEESRTYKRIVDFIISYNNLG